MSAVIFILAAQFILFHNEIDLFVSYIRPISHNKYQINKYHCLGTPKCLFFLNIKLHGQPLLPARQHPQAVQSSNKEIGNKLEHHVLKVNNKVDNNVNKANNKVVGNKVDNNVHKANNKVDNNRAVISSVEHNRGVISSVEHNRAVISSVGHQEEVLPHYHHKQAAFHVAHWEQLVYVASITWMSICRKCQILHITLT